MQPGRIEKLLPKFPSRSSSCITLHSYPYKYSRCVEAECFPSSINSTERVCEDFHCFLPREFYKVRSSCFDKKFLLHERGKMRSLRSQKTTEDLGCTFNCVWEYQKHNSLGACNDNEKALYVFQRLLEFEKSEAPFKDNIVSYIDLLQRGAGRLFLSEHSRTLDIELHKCSVYVFRLNEPKRI